MDTDSDNQQQCYHCSAALTEATRICPSCGRKQVRTCYCGAEIPVTARVCPHCSADWSHSRRVRRKSKSKRLDWKKLLKFAFLGSFLALIAASVLNLLITGLASRSLARGQQLPDSLIQRLGLAWAAIWTALAALGHELAEKGGGLGTLTVVLVTGAALGVVAYFLREGFWRRWRRYSSSKVKRRRSPSASDNTEEP